ncbi:MAG: energy transducer TonB [Candidatus Acidiferrales bacterium]
MPVTFRKGSVAIVAVVSLFLLLPGCETRYLEVKSITQPEYPIPARSADIQGTVVVGIEIGINGEVLSAHGEGANPVLVSAAERNAREWVWGPFPPKFTFPHYHEIQYVFRLIGKPLPVAVGPPTVTTDLPDRVQITATRYYSDLGLTPVQKNPRESKK